MIDAFLKRHDTTLTREFVAGITTFAAMAYILVVNPSMLAITGMDQGALITATALAAAIGSILMGVLTNYPIALAPGMGLNAFFTFTICGQMGVPWQGALGLVFWNGVLFLALSLTGFRAKVVKAIPEALKIGITGGIGLFIVVIGLKNLGLFGNPAPGFFAIRFGELGPQLLAPILLAALGVAMVIVLMKLRVAASILIAIAAITIIGLFIKVGGVPITARPNGIVDAPASVLPVAFKADLLYPFRNIGSAWIILLTLVFVDLFDSVGTLIGVSRQAKLTDKNGDLPKMQQALAADAGATTIGATLGVSPVTSYIESATGVQAGGRTGLTAIVVAACFFIALFFHPVIAIIPAAAVAPALLVVGALMMQGVRSLDWADWRSAVAAIATVVLIPINFQIAEGIAAGFVIYTILMVCTGEAKKINPILAVLSGLFALKFAHDLFSRSL